RPVEAAHCASLGRVELEQRAGGRADRVVGGLHLDLAAEHDDPRALADLVLAELLARVETDQHRATVLGIEHDGRPRALRRLYLVELPDAHRENLTHGPRRSPC